MFRVWLPNDVRGNVNGFAAFHKMDVQDERITTYISLLHASVTALHHPPISM